MPRGRKKKNIIEAPEITNIKNCCYWSNCTKYCSKERSHLCCAFCPIPNCSVRCKDYNDGCENLTDNKFLKIDPYLKYQKVINFKEKKEETIIQPEETKRKRGRPKKL